MYKIMLISAVMLMGCQATTAPMPSQSPRPIHENASLPLKDQLRQAVDHIWDGVVQLDQACSDLAKNQNELEDAMSLIG